MSNKDDNLLKKYKLEDTQKRLQKLWEYTFITSPNTLTEEGDDENGEGNENSQQTNNGMVQNAPNQQQDNSGAEQNAQQSNIDPMQNAQDNSMTNPQQGQGFDTQMPNQNIDSQEQNQGDENSDDVTEMEPGDEVIDVDELTDAQEELSYKIDGVDDKLIKISKVIDRLIPAIDNNNERIEDLKREFERRNPTEEEKMNKRIKDSYPYNLTTGEAEKDAKEKEYVLRKDDLNKPINDLSVYKTFDIPNKMTEYLDLY